HIAIMEAGKMVTKGDVAGLKDHYRMIRVLVDISRTNDATAAITGLGGVVECQSENEWLVVSSEEQNCNYVLSRLIEEGIEILEMKEDEPDLEDIFIHSTEGKVT
ncbi:MAG: DUF4162 domain-containing protein, partial [Verrucomicrobiota bacterium]